MNIEYVAFMALGALVGTAFWIFALVYYFPTRFRDAGKAIEEQTVKRVNQEIDARIQAFLDPKNQQAGELVGALVGRGYAVLLHDPQVKDQIKGTIMGYAHSAARQIAAELGLSEAMIAKIKAVGEGKGGNSILGMLGGMGGEGEGGENPMALLMKMFGGV